MKAKEKKKLLISILVLILILVVIIAIIWYITRQNKWEEPKQTEGEEFVQIQDDGTKINTSTKLKEEKQLDELKIGDIQLTEKNGQSTLLANVTNTTEEDVEVFFIDIILYDKIGNEIDTITGVVPPVKAGKTVQLNAGITQDYANAYDFKVEKK